MPALCGRLAIAVAFLVPAGAIGQSAALTYVHPDYDPTVAHSTAEPIPPGTGLEVTVPVSGVLHARVEVAGRMQHDRGVLCFGLSCVLRDNTAERVRTSAGLVSGGLAVRPWWRWGRWGAGLQGDAGVTMLWVAKRGLETGRSLQDRDLALGVGAGLAVGVRPFGPDLWLVLTARAALHVPMKRYAPMDAYEPLHSDLAQRSIGLELRWNPEE